MIQITDKTKCCGCSACYNICPKNAIQMVEDENGFKYPVVDKEKCINCGLCEKVCPYNNEYTKKEIFSTSLAYGGWNTDEEIRKKSTSGGVFSAIAKYIFDNNGVVCGAIYDNDFKVVHDIAYNMEDLKKMNGSKYAQSDMKNNFKRIKEHLENNKLVLFSGTPCQVAGLNSFLGKEYENLYTCDIVCHGVPSPKVFEKYKKELEEKNSSKIADINFRDKISGWQGYSFSTQFKNDKKYTEKSNKNEYMKAFIGDIDLRESCPTCKFAKLPRYTDFTLGDFWGVDNCYPELNKDNKGTSLVLVHTQKGKDLLLENKDIFIKQCDLSKSIKGNPSILEHKPANKNREKFFKELENTEIAALVNKYIPKPSLAKKILGKSKVIFNKITKNFTKKM